jgi:cell division protein FtsL
MIRLASVFWLILVSATALATFAVKYEVQALDGQLSDIKRTTAAENRELRVLDAEWAYLNRPDMLAAMNGRFLSLTPITQKQLQTTIADIPMRPLPPPPPAPVPPVDATGPVAAVDAVPPERALPVAPVSTDRPVGSEKLAMASAPIRPLLVRETVSPGPAPPRTRPLDSRSLDRLIARIAAGR